MYYSTKIQTFRELNTAGFICIFSFTQGCPIRGLNVMATYAMQTTFVCNLWKF